MVNKGHSGLKIYISFYEKELGKACLMWAKASFIETLYLSRLGDGGEDNSQIKQIFIRLH